MQSIRSVDAQINYLAPGSFINRRFVAPGVEVNTGTYEPYAVKISDARPIQDSFTLDSHGFVLAEHRSAITDFFDKEQVEALYQDEVVDVVKRLTGASVVIPQGWMVRTSGDVSKHQRKVVG